MQFTLGTILSDNIDQTWRYEITEIRPDRQEYQVVCISVPLDFAEYAGKFFAIPESEAVKLIVMKKGEPEGHPLTKIFK
jgi:hypothetical protein